MKDEEKLTLFDRREASGFPNAKLQLRILKNFILRFLPNVLKKQCCFIQRFNSPTPVILNVGVTARLGAL